MHLPRPPRDPAARNGTDQDAEEGAGAAVPFDVAAQRRRQKLRVAGEVAQHRRQHHGGDLAQRQHARPDHLAGGLEAQERDGGFGAPVHVAADAVDAAFDQAGLDDGGGEEDEERLQEEGGGEREALQRAQEAREAGEEEGAGGEADDGGEGFGPAVGFGLGGGVGAAEADEDGVAGLH